MTNQEKICYLQKYREGEQEICQLEWEMEVWRSRAEKITPGMGTGRGSGSDRIQHAVEVLAELQEKLADQLVAVVRLREEVVGEIDRVEEPQLRQLLKLRYIRGMTWERVADTMNYSFRQVTRMHRQALECVLPERCPGMSHNSDATI